MKVLFKAVTIFRKGSEYHQQTLDLLLEDGNIAAVGHELTAEGARVIAVPGLCVSPGWVDMRVALREPGLEQEESFASLKEAAARGGFTGLVLLPNSSPVVDTKDTLQYIRQQGQAGAVHFYPTAAVTKKAAGEEFSDMMDLYYGGAVAFTDGDHPIQNSDIFLKSLLYLQPLNALLISRPEDHNLSVFGQMHEGVTSTLLGLKGIPSLAEEMMIIRDLQLLEYALSGGRLAAVTPSLLHFSLLSTQRAVELVRDAKARGLPVSCDVAAHQLAFDDTVLHTFDTNLKVSPPLRSAADRTALLEGLADGTIDAIVSGHTPHAPENKDREFDLAAFGMTGLETAFSLSCMHSRLPLETLVDKLSLFPRQILRLPPVPVAPGQPANLTFFEPDAEWVFSKTYSRSKNTPFLNQPLKGKVRGIANQGEFRWFD